MTRSDESFATLLLSSHLASESAEPLGPGEFWRLGEPLENQYSLLLDHNDVVESAAAESRLAADRIRSLLDRGTALSFELEGLEQRGITVISAFDEGYPPQLRDRLGTAAPPLLYVAGQPGMMTRPGLGIVGSRSIGEEATEITRQAAEFAAENEMNVVSGGAKGVDQVAMRAAFEAGGHVVGVLADSLIKNLREPSNRAAVFEGQACLLTIQNPSLGFTPGNAMARNKIIYGLSERTLVVRADLEGGGTWAGAKEALKRRYGLVVVWTGDGAGPGNEALVKMGGHPLADITNLLQDHEAPSEASPSSGEQLGLFAH